VWLNRGYSDAMTLLNSGILTNYYCSMMR